jgi:hypothetical protein
MLEIIHKKLKLMIICGIQKNYYIMKVVTLILLLAMKKKVKKYLK